MTQQPGVDVILCTANRDSEGLARTLDSLRASSFRDFRVLLVNDSALPLHAGLSLADLDIHVIDMGVNAGLTRALKAAEALLSAPLVARMDCGDTMDPERLQRQRAFLIENSDHVLVGVKSQLLACDGKGQRTLGDSASSEDIPDINSYLLWRNPFVHGSIMFRREDFLAVGGYDARYSIAQDFNLYMRMRPHGRFFILPDLLYTHRFNLASSNTVNKNKKSLASSFRSRCSFMSKREFFSPMFLAGAVRDALLLMMPSRLLLWVRFSRHMHDHEYALD
jgi:glycosyltransferase involved in cell wall biosynthesis